MSAKPLHIISFDNPYPPVYGGTIDVYYKIVALKKLGYNIFLHCFVKQKTIVALELSSIAEVILYEYKFSLRAFLSPLPFSVALRFHKDLVPNILKVKAPILFESLKTTFCIYDNRLKNYCKILRLHNLEDNYFAGIAKSESSLLKKIMYTREAKKYSQYSVYSQFDNIAALSHSEYEVVGKIGKASFVPVFHGNSYFPQLSEFGKNAFYHGDLGTADNMRSAKFLIDVFRELPNIPFKIASSSRFSEIIRIHIGGAKNIQFVVLENFDHLQNLLGDAQLTISWSFQKSGTKLKLINALFHGRHCIINENIVDDNLVSDFCEIATDKESLTILVNNLMQKPFEISEERKSVLLNHLNDNQNARTLDEIIEAACEKK